MAQINHDNSDFIIDFGDDINAMFIPDFICEDDLVKYFDNLSKVPFCRVTYQKYGKTRSTPRSTYCYGQYNGLTSARYRGKEFPTETIPEWLESLKKEVEMVTLCDYNAVLINKYENGADYICWHQDDESFLEHKTVASISIGCERDFMFKAVEKGQVHKIKLSNGSLFVLNDGLWHHIPKRANAKSIRYNITFRKVKDNNGIGNYYYYNRGYIA